VTVVRAAKRHNRMCESRPDQIRMARFFWGNLLRTVVAFFHIAIGSGLKTSDFPLVLNKFRMRDIHGTANAEDGGSFSGASEGMVSFKPHLARTSSST
jgi:hypothetical protein